MTKEDQQKYRREYYQKNKHWIIPKVRANYHNKKMELEQLKAIASMPLYRKILIAIVRFFK